MKTIKPNYNSEFLPITCPIGSADYKMFVSVVNQGIDSHLEGFTKSEFGPQEQCEECVDRFVFNFHVSELPILIRRLEELETEEAEMWAYDIKETDEYKRA